VPSLAQSRHERWPQVKWMVHLFFFVNSNHLLYLHLPKVVTKAAANMWYAREKGLDPKFEQLVAFKIGLLPRMFYQPACFQFHELCRVL
jgi:hypothetical protein